MKLFTDFPAGCANHGDAHYPAASGNFLSVTRLAIGALDGTVAAGKLPFTEFGLGFASGVGGLKLLAVLFMFGIFFLALHPWDRVFHFFVFIEQ